MERDKEMTETLEQDFSILNENNKKKVVEMTKFLVLTRNRIVPGFLEEAVMILNMTYEARLTPELPCFLYFGGVGIAVLCGEAGKEVKEPYRIKEAVDYPGGPKRASSDGLSGVKTIWIGLMKLYILPAYREYLV
ncbi:MAG: hypothetical protein LBE10_04455 [Treponema sp.]|nr:hypothetical protein [Treponema sp.]